MPSVGIGQRMRKPEEQRLLTERYEATGSPPEQLARMQRKLDSVPLRREPVRAKRSSG